MKKFWKKILVVTLVITLMIIGLVCCGKNWGKPDESNETTNVVQKKDEVKDVKKRARVASELVESLKAVEVKGDKVIGEGGKELSKNEVKEIAKLYASKDEKVVSKGDREKIESMVNVAFGEDEGKKIINAYKNDKKLQEKILEDKPIEDSVNSSKGKDEETGKTSEVSKDSKVNKDVKTGEESKVSESKKSNDGKNVAVVSDNKDKKPSVTEPNNKPSTNKPAETKATTKPSSNKKPSESKKPSVSTTKSTTKKDVVEYKNESERYNINFKTVDNYASSGADSRVFQAGKNGVGEKVYKVKYVNGVRQGSELVSDSIISAPQNQIIERYVKVQDEKWETREIEDKNKPIYEEKWADRWFVNYYDVETSELVNTKYFYSAGDAFNAYSTEENYSVAWGTADPEMTGKELIGYETSTQNVKVQDAKYEWRQ